MENKQLTIFREMLNVISNNEWFFNFIKQILEQKLIINEISYLCNASKVYEIILKVTNRNWNVIKFLSESFDVIQFS